MTKLASGLSLLLLWSCLGTSESFARRPSALSHSLQNLIEEWVFAKPAGAVAVAIVSPEDTEYLFGGKLSTNNDAPPDEDTLFEIGSITKGFTGLLLADQVLAGNVNLNDTLKDLLTDWEGRFSAPAGKVTLLELATHSSGLPRLPDNLIPAPLPNNPYVNYTSQKLYQWLDKAELEDVGSFLYSNAGAGIAGHSLEVREKKKYESLLKERVLIPLGLRDTTVTLSDDQKSRIAPAHSFMGDQISNWDFDVLAPAGAIRSSVSELGHFLRLATGLEEIQKSLGDALDFATQPYGATEQDLNTIGLFWFQNHALLQDKALIWHDGATGGYQSFLGWVPERQVGVVVLASIQIGPSGPTADYLGFEILKNKLGL